MRAFRLRPSAGFLLALAGLLALAHALLAVTAAVGESMTADEIAYLTAGQVYNQTGDYRMQPENGNLPQRWVALPATLAGATLPPRTGEAWRRSDVWVYGHAFFYGRNATGGDTWLWAGRGMTALFSAATGLLIFAWSRALFGWRGGFLSLGLFALCPSFLAHGALATSDVITAFFFLAATGAWWRHLEQPGPGGAALSAAVFALACVVKYSAVLLLPIFGLIAVGWWLGLARRTSPGATLRRLLRSALVHAVVAWAVIWLFYGFRFSAFSPALAANAEFYRGGWDWILTDLGSPGILLAALRNFHVLPEAFLYGGAFVLQFAQERAAFLNGDYRLGGWVEFFPYAFAVKTTLPFLVLLLTGVGVAAWRRRAAGTRTIFAGLRPLLPLGALLLVYGVTSLASHLNIGERHLLPIYPPLFIAVGIFGTWLDVRRPLALVVVAGLTLWHASESWRIRPHYLAYFNALGGGPENGWRHLVDSSLDWGQDLPGLADWLGRHARNEPVFLSYFGSGEPDAEGIRAHRLPFVNGFRIPHPWVPLEPGVYCIGATMLQQVYSPVRGPWTPELEKEYRWMRGFEPALTEYFRDPRRRVELDREASPEKWQRAAARLDLLRFARLCHYLRARQPDAQVGYSILIYRLSAAEIAAATQGTLEQWRAAIEAAERRENQQ